MMICSNDQFRSEKEWKPLNIGMEPTRRSAGLSCSRLRYTDEVVAEIVQAGEPIFATTYGDLSADQFLDNLIKTHRRRAIASAAKCRNCAEKRTLAEAFWG